VGAVTTTGLLKTRVRQEHLLLGALIVALGGILGLAPLRATAFGVLSAAVVVLTLVRPIYALYLVCLAIPFGSLFEVSLGGVSVRITEGFLGLLIVGWGARVLAYREWPTWPRLAIAVSLFIGAASLSLLNARDLPLATKEILKWVEFLAVLVFVSDQLSAGQRTTLVACLLIAGSAQALLGIYQFLSRSGPEGFVLMDRFMRAYGTFEQPNPFAGYLGLSAPIAFAWGSALIDRKHTRPDPKWLLWIALVAFCLITAAIGMSWSRGGWLAFGAALLVMGVARSRRTAGAVLALLLLVGLLSAAGGVNHLPASISQRLRSLIPASGTLDVCAVEVTDENYATVERLAFWQSALSMWTDRPWIGVGIGNYATAYPDYALPKWRTALGHAHNYYLNIASETGLVGLLAYLALWVVAAGHVIARLCAAKDATERALLLAALGVLTHAAVHNAVDNLWVHNMYVQVAIVLGLTCTNAYHRSSGPC